MAIVKKTQISIDINMDENNIPEEIKWTAPDGGILNMNTKAILLSFLGFRKPRIFKNGFMG